MLGAQHILNNILLRANSTSVQGSRHNKDASQQVTSTFACRTVDTRPLVESELERPSWRDKPVRKGEPREPKQSRNLIKIKDKNLVSVCHSTLVSAGNSPTDDLICLPPRLYIHWTGPQYPSMISQVFPLFSFHVRLPSSRSPSLTKRSQSF